MNPHPSLARETKAVAYTATQIASASRISKQSVLKSLAGIPAAEIVIVRGQETQAWSYSALPANIIKRLERAAGNGFSPIDYLNGFQTRWRPALAWGEIAQECWDYAKELRAALLPSLQRANSKLFSDADRVRLGLEEYTRAIGYEIGERHWRRLRARALWRDGGMEDFQRLEIYLPERLKQKSPLAGVVVDAPLKGFCEIDTFIAGCSNPHAPNKNERDGIWSLALRKCTALVKAGASEKSASRRVREFICARAPFLALSPHALRVAFDRKLARWKAGGQDPKALRDRRADNGDRAEYPVKDIRLVRHSAVLKNGKRINAAWRDEYSKLSEYTRQRHPPSRQCPRAFYEFVNREKVDALYARVQGKRTLRRLVGGVTRNAEGIRSMDRWTADDMTSNIEVAFRNQDGTISLIQPQIIAVMDFASRKWVGWSISNDKAPTAELVCEGILVGIRSHGVPRQLWLENGFVFGKSLNVNGKVGEHGRTVVAGLAQYGCAIHHFDKMNPTSKGELEKSFDLFQRHMEEHPGYGGRMQIRDATEDFKREQRLIRSGKARASDFRYTFDEFVFRVMPDLVEKYNAERQYGHLGGLSPNEAFDALKDPNDPPIKFDNQLYWMLANERYRVRVSAGGVTFRHYGRKIQVRGGELAKADYIGTELWALVDRKDSSMVTFMTLDYRRTFTVETCLNPSADESRIASGSGVLAGELGKIGEHMHAVEAELKDLKAEFGNPRQDLLVQLRGETSEPAGARHCTTRRTIIPSRIEASAEQMKVQRLAITAKRRQNTTSLTKARRLDIPTVLVGDDDQSRRALELLGDSPPRMAGEIEITERNEP